MNSIHLHLKKYLILLIVCAFVFLIDRYSKIAVLELLHQENTQNFKINNFLNFTEVWNQGISFGFLSHYNLPPSFFIGSTIAIIIIILWLMKSISPIFQGMIIGGGLGNIVDRVLFGSVFDFIDLHVYNVHYPTFNLADSFIVLSTAILVIKEVFFKRPSSRFEEIL